MHAVLRHALPYTHPPAEPDRRGRLRPLRGLAIVVSALVLALIPVTGASAHVKVRTDGTPVAGGYATLRFSVPTESDSASTVSLAVTLPADHPFSSVRVKPQPGWTAKLTETKFDQPVAVGTMNLTEAVTKVTWTAQPGHALGPDEFGEFALSVGPLPAAGELRLPAVQRYSDGTVVRWTQHSTPGADEPEHPAPTLTIAATAPAESEASTNTTAVVAIVLGGIAVLIALAALIRARPRGDHR